MNEESLDKKMSQLPLSTFAAMKAAGAEIPAFVAEQDNTRIPIGDFVSKDDMDFILNYSEVTKPSDFSQAYVAGKRCGIRFDIAVEVNPIGRSDSADLWSGVYPPKGSIAWMCGSLSSGLTSISDSQSLCFVAFYDKVLSGDLPASMSGGPCNLIVYLSATGLHTYATGVLDIYKLWSAQPSPFSIKIHDDPNLLVRNPSQQSPLVFDITNITGNKRELALLPSQAVNNDLDAAGATQRPRKYKIMVYDHWTTPRWGYTGFPISFFEEINDDTDYPEQTPEVTFYQEFEGSDNEDQTQLDDPSLTRIVVDIDVKHPNGTNSKTISGLLVDPEPEVDHIGENEVYGAWITFDSNGDELYHIGWKKDAPQYIEYDGHRYFQVDNNSAEAYIRGENSLYHMTIPNGVNTLLLEMNRIDVANFIAEIDNTNNSSDVSLSVDNYDGNNTTHLKYSADAGNVLKAGKFYQVTCVGSCWTLAEFVDPTPNV